MVTRRDYTAEAVEAAKSVLIELSMLGLNHPVLSWYEDAEKLLRHCGLMP
jgi:hypothetical protein